MPDRTLRVGQYTLSITHSDKVLFPQNGITKGDVVDYYAEIANVMLPLVRGRPTTMQRLPDGLSGETFFQKDAPSYFPHWIKTISIKQKTGNINTHYVLCENAATLVYLASQACITPHVWLSRKNKLGYPDRMIFDLDPPKDFKVARQTAQRLRALLEDELGLNSLMMITGSRGLHVVIPLEPRASFDTVRAFALDIARLLVSRDPTQLTLEQRINKRQGRMFVDTLRNIQGQTAVAPYALRALPGAPVATPIEWNEISKISSARQFTIKNIFQRLDRKGDPWAAITRQSQSLSQPRQRLDKLLENQRNRPLNP